MRGLRGRHGRHRALPRLCGPFQHPRSRWHAVAVGPPFYTVIELETGTDHGTYDTEAETAACLAFLGLRIDQVEILSNVPLLAPSLTGVP